MTKVERMKLYPVFSDCLSMTKEYEHSQPNIKTLAEIEMRDIQGLTN